MSTALVMSGGGARGAYQAGVLLGLSELGLVQENRQPFDILVGTSAGSLNCTLMAAYSHRPLAGLLEMCSVWGNLKAAQVFRTDGWRVVQNTLGWLRDLSLGGLLGNVQPRSLLDTRPLRTLLRNVPWNRLSENLAAGHYQALGVLATNYTTSNGVLFLQDRIHQVPDWGRVRYSVRRAPIQMDHVLASSAIPVIFPSIRIGDNYFGDGSLRNTAPLGPAIQLGARKVVAVGVREAGDAVTHLKPGCSPKLADVAGTLLDAVLLDAIEVDVQHCLRMNRLAHTGPGPDGERFRPVDVLWLRPSQSLADLALQMEKRIPLPVRYLLRGLGDAQATAELASYLIFDGDYCRLLIEQGKRDVLARRDEIVAFFRDTPEA